MRGPTQISLRSSPALMPSTGQNSLTTGLLPDCAQRKQKKEGWGGREAEYRVPNLTPIGPAVRGHVDWISRRMESFTSPD